MSKLTLSQAPPPARPLRWLLSAPLWGMAAGGWLVWHGETALLGRWSLQTVALVHLFTLGVLGNAMLGSLLQFLPVAAESAMPLETSVSWLHAAFNLGLALFVFALHAGARADAMALAAVLLALAPLVFAVAALPSLLRRGAQRVVRAGIGFALCALIVTVVLGAMLVGILRGGVALPLDRFADAHALFGLLGWVIGLMAAVGSVTLPMFQGTAVIPGRWLAGWAVACGVGLVVGAALHLACGRQAALALAVAPAALGFVAASLWLPWRSARRRDTSLAWFWRFGTLALGTACLIGLADAAWDLPPRLAMLAGVLGIGIGLPSMLIGMQLEIVPFLAWIGLRRDCPRGARIPGAGLLLPERDKRIALFAHLAGALALCAAAWWPALARTAGAFVMPAYALTLACLVAPLLRARRFVRGHLPQEAAT